MKVEVSDIKYSPTGRRMDAKVAFQVGDGFFSPIVTGRFNFFAMGSEAAIARLKDKEGEVAKELVENRQTWLNNAGKTFYYYHLKGSETRISIRKTKYQEDDA